MTGAGTARVVVMSGGSHGVGRAIALDLASRGMTVVLLHSPGGAAAAQQTLAELRAAGPAADAFATDVADEAQVTAVFEQVLQRHHRVDVVINGAGFYAPMPVEELDLDVLDRMHRTLIRGLFVMTRMASRSIGNGGAIITMSSLAARMDTPGSAAYAAGKAAAEALTAVAARELRTRGISVNAVALGPTAGDAAAFDLDSSWSDSDDNIATVTEVVGNLASPNGHWVTGQVIAAGMWPLGPPG